MYVAVVKGDGTLRGVFQSFDLGTTWRDTEAPALGTQGGRDLAISLSKTHVYVGGTDNVIVSPITSNEWVDVRGGTETAQGVVEVPHSDHQAFAIAPDGQVYAGNDGGIWRYDHSKDADWRYFPVKDGVGTWYNLNTKGLQTIQFYGLAMSPRDPNILIGGSQDNGYARTTDGGHQTPWNQIDGGDGTKVRFSPQDHNVVYRFGSWADPNRSPESGKDGTWTPIYVFNDPEGDPKNPQNGQFYNRLALHPTDPNRLIISGDRGVVWETDTANKPDQNGNVGWVAIGPRLGQ
jgi:hypothetical protein